MFGWLKRRILLREVRGLLERLEKEGHLSFFKAFFGGSKKATAVLAGILLVVFQGALGLDEGTAQKLVTLIMSYIGAQGLVDLGLAISGNKTQ